MNPKHPSYVFRGKWLGPDNVEQINDGHMCASVPPGTIPRRRFNSLWLGGQQCLLRLVNRLTVLRLQLLKLAQPRL